MENQKGVPTGMWREHISTAGRKQLVTQQYYSIFEHYPAVMLALALLGCETVRSCHDTTKRRLTKIPIPLLPIAVDLR